MPSLLARRTAAGVRRRSRALRDLPGPDYNWFVGLWDVWGALRLAPHDHAHGRGARADSSASASCTSMWVIWHALGAQRR